MFNCVLNTPLSYAKLEEKKQNAENLVHQLWLLIKKCCHCPCRLHVQGHVKWFQIALVCRPNSIFSLIILSSKPVRFYIKWKTGYYMKYNTQLKWVMPMKLGKGDEFPIVHKISCHRFHSRKIVNTKFGLL